MDCPYCEAKRLGHITPEWAEELARNTPILKEAKADDAVIAKRLAACAACPALRDGVFCAYCGCIVRFRSRPKDATCPHPGGDRWNGASTDGVTTPCGA
jgi:hypothetical protein